MNVHQIGDVDIVAYARAIRGLVIAAKYCQLLRSPGGNLAGALYKMRSAGRGLPCTTSRVSACYIEITKYTVANFVGYGGVTQHPFCHQLRSAVRAHRYSHTVFYDGYDRGCTVHGSCRRE